MASVEKERYDNALDIIATLASDLAPLQRLVIAARKVAFEDRSDAAIKELDEASKAFAEMVEWEDEPKSTTAV